jgi:hypothetical protein
MPYSMKSACIELPFTAFFTLIAADRDGAKTQNDPLKLISGWASFQLRSVVY